ncbi:MAG TPA: class II aldolase/adducin family protein [Stellaceae bacterium]|jgi:L-fuculose-phosphate aldolase
MASETELREQLATCARIMAMQGLLGLHGHISVFQPETQRMLISPGAGSDKANLCADDMVLAGLDGKAVDGKRPPLEWPIHTAIHAARDDALAIAHLHPPYATLFSISQREYRPITMHSGLFGKGIATYREAHLITSVDRGQRLKAALGDKRAAFQRGHGITVVARNIAEMLHITLCLENDALKTLQAATLGELGTLSAEEVASLEKEITLEMVAPRTWAYLTTLEARWDRQPNSGRAPLFP